MFDIPTDAKDANVDFSTPPDHDEFALQELGESLQVAMNGKRKMTLTIYRIGTVTGTIIKMDAATRKVHLQTDNQGLFKIHFLEIWSVIDPAD